MESFLGSIGIDMRAGIVDGPAPPERRARDVAFLREVDGGQELTTIAWTWAALLVLQIDPEDIFHGSAYKP